MKIAIFSTNVQGIYSGGRYLSLIMGYSLSRAGASVAYYTNLVPTFDGDFDAYRAEDRLDIVLEADWPDRDPDVDWVIVIPTGSLNDAFYSKAVGFAERSGARIALLSFETANWFNALTSPPRSPLPWESWAKVVENGGLVLTIAREGIAPARDFYSRILPETVLHYDFWYPAINDRAIEAIGWQEIPKYPNRIVSFVRTNDPHKGASAFLQLPPEFFENKTLSLIFGRGIDREFIQSLQDHTRSVHGFTLQAYDRVSDEEKLALLASSSVLFFPSGFEGFGYPPIEAAAVGTPTVAYDLPVVRETLGPTGHFVRPGDIEQVAITLEHVAGAPPFDPAPLPAPGMFTTLEAGQALMEKLRKAEAGLEPATSVPPLPPGDWTLADSAWFNASASQESSGLIQVTGTFSYADPLADPFLVIADTQSVEFDIFEQPRPGLIRFSCRLPEAYIDLDNGEVTLEAQSANRPLLSCTLPIQIDPTQRLSRNLADDAAIDPERGAAIIIEADTFGEDPHSRLILLQLVSELSLMNFQPYLIAPNCVMDRLARHSELAGLFHGVSLNNPVTTRQDGRVRIRVREDASGDMPEDPVEIVTAPDGDMNLMIRKGPAMAGKSLNNELLPALFGESFETPRILLTGALGADGLTASALSLIHAVRAEIGTVHTPAFYCIDTDDAARNTIDLPSNVVAVDLADCALRWDASDIVLVNCSAGTMTGSLPLQFADKSAKPLDATRPDQIEQAVKEILVRLDSTRPQQASLMNSITGSDFKMSASGQYGRMARLREGRQAMLNYVTSPRQIETPSRSVPRAGSGYVHTSQSRPVSISSFLRACSFRINADYVELRATETPILEFELEETARTVMIDMVLLLKSSRADKRKIQLILNNRMTQTLEVKPGRYQRLKATFEMNEDDRHSGLHTICLVPATCQAGDTLRVRSLAVFPSEFDPSQDAADMDTSSAGASLVRTRMEHSPPSRPAPRFSLTLNSAQSIISCGRGWGARERHYRWTIGRVAELQMPYQSGTESELKLKILAGAFIGDWAEQARMAIQINGRRIGDLSFTGQPSEQTLILPHEVSKAGFDRLDIIVESPTSPVSKGLNSDQRELGFCVYRIDIEPVSVTLDQASETNEASLPA